jgi:hypothetical protein
MDTGIDLTNGDIMPNVDVAASCVFLYATTPTANAPVETFKNRRRPNELVIAVPLVLRVTARELQAR